MKLSSNYLAFRRIGLKIKNNMRAFRPKLGVLRIDYRGCHLISGDLAHPESFDFDVVYRVIPGLTFEMAQTQNIPAPVKANFIRAVQFLHQNPDVSCITSDCGFMVCMQDEILQHTDKPVCLSPLVALSQLRHIFHHNHTIAILTANSMNLAPALDSLMEKYGYKTYDAPAIKLLECRDIDGFDAVEKMEPMDPERVGPGLVHLLSKVLADDPNIKCILIECTQLPRYANLLRSTFGLPVYDAITTCNAFMGGIINNHLFGHPVFYNDNETTFYVKYSYEMGNELTQDEREMLINKCFIES